MNRKELRQGLRLGNNLIFQTVHSREKIDKKLLHPASDYSSVVTEMIASLMACYETMKNTEKYKHRKKLLKKIFNEQRSTDILNCFFFNYLNYTN